MKKRSKFDAVANAARAKASAGQCRKKKYDSKITENLLCFNEF